MGRRAVRIDAAAEAGHPRRILVTGAAGFIGRWVVGELLAEGHEVLPIDNLVAAGATFLPRSAPW